MQRPTQLGEYQHSGTPLAGRRSRRGSRWTMPVLLLLALLAASCGPSATEEGNEETTEATSTASNGDVSGELSVIMEEVPDTEVVRGLLGPFNEQYPDIQVNIEALPYDQIRDRIVTSALAPSPTYDVVIVDNPWMVDFAQGEYLLPLDDLVQTDGYDYEDFVEPLRDIGEVDDTVYGVPFYNYALAFIYRQDLLEEVDAEPPTTLDEYMELMSTLTSETGVSGAAMQPQRGYKIFEEWANWLYAAGGDLRNDDGEVVLDSPEARQALEGYISTYEDAAPDGSLNWGFDEALRGVSGGEAATLLSYNWMLPTLNSDEGPAGDLAGEFALAEVPGGKAVLGSWHWAVAANTEQVDAATTFISWMTSPEQDRQRVIAGGAPVRESVMTDEEVWEQGFGQEYYETVLATLEDAEPLADGPGAEEVINAVGTQLNAAVAGEVSVDEAITQAAEEASSIFEQGQ